MLYKSRIFGQTLKKTAQMIPNAGVMFKIGGMKNAVRINHYHPIEFCVLGSSLSSSVTHYKKKVCSCDGNLVRENKWIPFDIRESTDLSFISCCYTLIKYRLFGYSSSRLLCVCFFEISSLRRVEISKQTNSKSDDSNLYPPNCTVPI